MPVRTLINFGKSIQLPKQVKIEKNDRDKPREQYNAKYPQIDSPIHGLDVNGDINSADLKKILEIINKHYLLNRENMMSPKDVPLDIIAIGQDYTSNPPGSVIPLVLNQSITFYNHQVPQGLKYIINRIEFFGFRLNLPVVPYPILCDPTSLAAWVFLFKVNGKNPIYNPYQFPNIGGAGTFQSEGFPFLSTEVFNPINNYGGFRFEVPEGSTITLDVKCQIAGGAIPAQFVCYGCRFRGFITSAKEQR